MAAIHVAALLSHPVVRSAIERALAARGTHGDTLLIHANPREAAMLRFMGGAGTVNPRTGLRQFYDPDAPGHDTPGVSGGQSGSGMGSLGGGVGGYGQAGNQGGSGLGAGGGHSGQSGYYSVGGTYDRLGAPTTPGGGTGYAAPAPISNMPPAAPVGLTPMMSSTATTDLAASRFGALPAWATTPYQIGMAPSSYPTPGVNAALGAPGAAGGLGGGGLPGGSGGGAPGGGGVTSIGAPGGPVVRLPTGGVGVTLPGGAIANVGYGNPASAQGYYPTLPNGQTLSQYLTSLKLGLTPNMPGAPTATGATPSASQPVANRLATTAQAAPGAAPQLHPAVQQAITQGILGGSVAAQPSLQTAAQRAAAQRLLGGGPVVSGRR